MRRDRYVRKHTIMGVIEQLENERKRLSDELEELEQLGPYSIKAMGDPRGILGVGYLRRRYGDLSRDKIMQKIEQIDREIGRLWLLLDETEYGLEDYDLEEFDIDWLEDQLGHLGGRKPERQRPGGMWDFKGHFERMGF